MSSIVSNPDNVNYSVHPAYKSLINISINQNGLNEEILSILKSLDLIMDQFAKNPKQSKIHHLMITEVNPKIDRLSSLLILNSPERSRINKGIRISLDFLEAEIYKLLLHSSEASVYTPERKNSKSEIITNKLKESGIAKLSVPNQIIEELFLKTENFRNQLKTKKLTMPEDMNCSISLPLEGGYFEIIRKILDENGVIEGVSNYYGKKLDLFYCALQYSNSAESWYKNCYADKNISTGKLSYLHSDEAFYAIKSLLYLSKVEKENGPFSYIENSPNLNTVKSLTLFYKGMDYGMRDAYRGVEKQNHPYYRKRYLEEDFRKEFVNLLPPVLQGSSHFGDDLTEEMEQFKSLSDSERAITSDESNFFIFDGCYLLHRGGQPDKGERWAMQIAYADTKMFSVAYSRESVGTTANKRPLGLKAKIKSLLPGRVKAFLRDSLFFRLKLILKVLLQGKNYAASLRHREAPVLNQPYHTGDVSQKPVSLREEYLKINNGEKIQVVDIGGAHSLQPSWYKLIGYADYLIFEPHKESFDVIQKLYQRPEYEGSKFILSRAGISATGGKQTLNITNTPTGSSLLEPDLDSDYVKNSKYFFPMRKEEIETETLNSELKRNNVLPCAIKLDVQGIELDIVKSIDKEYLDELLLIEMEVSVMGSMKKSATVEDSLIFMKENGFEVLDFRTNRGSRSPNADGELYYTHLYSVKYGNPSIAERLIEIDLIAVRDYRLLIKQKDTKKILKLISLYCAYNFYNEAAFLAVKTYEEGLIDSEKLKSILSSLKNLHRFNRSQLHQLEKFLETTDNQNWAQYMWVPSPSF